MEARQGSATPPKRSTSPSLRAKKVWGRVPPPGQLWQESLRSDEDLPTFGPTDTPKSGSELMSMVSSTMVELQKSTRSRKDKQTQQVDTANLKQKFIDKIVQRALESGHELRKSEGDSISRSYHDLSSRRVETEVPRAHSREASPQASERYRNTPNSENRVTRSTAKRLREELRISQEKYQKLEEMYLALLARKNPRDAYKKKYEDLRTKLARDQAQWSEQLQRLQQQLAEKTDECRRLATQRPDPVAQMKRDLDDLKTRVERTEQENLLMKSKVLQ